MNYARLIYHSAKWIKGIIFWQTFNEGIILNQDPVSLDLSFFFEGHLAGIQFLLYTKSLDSLPHRASQIFEEKGIIKNIRNEGIVDTDSLEFIYL